VAITKPSDLWQLGAHRLLCGDATSSDDVRRLMGGERAGLLVTDPPYLVDYDGGNHPTTWSRGGRAISPEDKTKHWDHYTDHATSVAFYEDSLRAALQGALSEVPLAYMFFAMMRAPIVFEAWRSVGLLLHEVLIWHKSRIVLSRCDYCFDYEPIAYGWLQGQRPEASRRPPANATAVWEVASAIEDGPQDHPTCKPVELYRRPITYHTAPGELLYEPFCGSGTALIAAEQLDRRCYALELSPLFCDVAVARWEAFTGRRALRRG
jgi:DNA modification methylase